MEAVELGIDIDTVKGFLDPAEGARLNALAVEVGHLGPCLEIGSYCGKSTVYLGEACRRVGSLLYALDHHRGSEEHQLGEEYHDPDLYDAQSAQMDSFGVFRQTVDRAGLSDVVVPLVAASGVVARAWSTPLAMVFIDGGHSREAAMTDYRSWASHVLPGGILAIHDIFEDPEAGGQAPNEIYQLALASGLFEAREMTGTLGVLERRR